MTDPAARAHARQQAAAVRVRIDCWCITCDQTIADAIDENDPDALAWLDRPFIVCPDCGNKRCPKATHHDLACTGSNAPGQPGSVYDVAARPSPTGTDTTRDDEK